MEQLDKEDDNSRSKMFIPKKTFLSRMQSRTESESSISPGQSGSDLLAHVTPNMRRRDDSISQMSLPDELRISFSEIDDGSIPLDDIDFSCAPSPDVDLTSSNIMSLEQNKDMTADKDLQKIASAISSTSEPRDNSSAFPQRSYSNYSRDSGKERFSEGGYQDASPSERFLYKQLENGDKNGKVSSCEAGARGSVSSEEGGERPGTKRSWDASTAMWAANIAKTEAPQVSTVGSSGEVLTKKKLVSPRRSSKNKHMENKLCQVCGDVAAGFYCGAFICEACKKFYMRAYKQDKLKYVCLRDKNCTITKESRVQCQYCRFQKCVDLNMYCPKQGEDHSNKDMNMADIPCRVCSAPSSGFHFGAITCEGCKGFFRRMAKEREPEKYQCNKSGKCEINMITRNLCKACRYRQCVTAGMSVEGSRIGRQPNSVKHAISMELKHQVKPDLDTPPADTLADHPIQIKQEPIDPSETPETEMMKSDDLSFWEDFVTSDYSAPSPRDKEKLPAPGSSSSYSPGVPQAPPTSYTSHSQSQLSTSPFSTNQSQLSPSLNSLNNHSQLSTSSFSSSQSELTSSSVSGNQSQVPSSTFSSSRSQLQPGSLSLGQSQGPASLYSPTQSQMPTSPFPSQSQLSSSSVGSSPSQQLPSPYSLPRPQGPSSSHTNPSSQPLTSPSHTFSFSQLYGQSNKPQDLTTSPVIPSVPKHQAPSKPQPPIRPQPQIRPQIRPQPLNQPQIRPQPLNQPQIRAVQAQNQPPIRTTPAQVRAQAQVQPPSHIKPGSHPGKHLPSTSSQQSQFSPTLAPTPSQAPTPQTSIFRPPGPPSTSTQQVERDGERLREPAVLEVGTGGSGREPGVREVGTGGSGREPAGKLEVDSDMDDFLNKIVEAGKVLQLLNYRVFDADINPTTSMNVEDIKSLFKSKYMDPRMGNHITSNVDMSIFSTKESTWNYMMTNFHHNTYITIRFAKMVPGFKSLLLNDQVKLIQYSIYPIELLNMSKVFDPATHQYNYFTYTKEEENIMMEQFPMLNVLKDHLIHIGDMVTSFEFTDEEFALMSALLLFPAEIHGLENPKAVDELQNKISSALQYYEEKSHPDGLTRYGVLLVRVAELVQCLLQHNLAIGLLLTHNPSIQVPQLFHELIIESIKEGQKT